MTPPTVEAGDLEAETLSREEQQRAERRREEWHKAVQSVEGVDSSIDVAPPSRRHDDRTVQVTTRWSVDVDVLENIRSLGFDDVVVKPAGVDRLVVKATYPARESPSC